MPRSADPTDAVDRFVAQWARERPDLDLDPMAERDAALADVVADQLARRFHRLVPSGAGVGKVDPLLIDGDLVIIDVEIIKRHARRITAP